MTFSNRAPFPQGGTFPIYQDHPGQQVPVLFRIPLPFSQREEKMVFPALITGRTRDPRSGELIYRTVYRFGNNLLICNYSLHELQLFCLELDVNQLNELDWFFSVMETQDGLHKISFNGA